MLNTVKALVHGEEGQGLTEYGLVLGIIAIAVITLIGSFRDEIVDIYQKAVDDITNRP